MNKGLTSFRALAFFSIFLFHTYFHSRNFEAGYLGVSAFFVLSGFLLTPILVDMKSSLNTRDFFIHFYGRRALRIFPLYYVYLVLAAAISLWAISQASHWELSQYRYEDVIRLNIFLEQLPWLLTYTYDFFSVSSYFRFTILGSHFWTLAVEEQFYLVWPLAIFFVPARYLKGFLLLTIAAGPLFRFLLAIILDTGVIPALNGADAAINVLPFSHVDAFAMGGFFALYGKNRPVYLVWASVFGVLALGIIAGWVSTGQVYLYQLGYPPYMKGAYRHIWGYSLVNFMFAYILVHVKSRTFMPALLENPILVYLGTISYGLYVFHFPVLWLTPRMMGGFSEGAQIAAAFLITVMISAASYELMEKRFTNLKDRYFCRA